jgi:ferric-dicitrate binding protein FerR (iron transport regulator)
MADARDAQSALALLKAIDDVTPSESVWTRIESNIAPIPARRAGGLRPILRFAAAASFLVAALSFIFVATVPRPTHAATVSLVAPDSDLRPGQRLVTGETFRAPTYVVLTLPDIGLIKLNRDTEVCFRRNNRIELLKGELFAEVTRGFEVKSRDALVTVHGTRFGVRASEAPSTIYVVEGKVEVAAGGQKLAIDGGRMATVGGAAGALDEDALGWMARHERTMLTLDAPKTLRQGDAPTWQIAFRTSSSAPLQLEPLRELSQQLFLTVVDPNRKEYSARLAGVVGRDVRHGANGLVRLDVFTPAVLEYRVDPVLFPAPGRYTVTLGYQGRQGALATDPITIEVR